MLLRITHEFVSCAIIEIPQLLQILNIYIAINDLAVLILPDITNYVI